MTKSCPNGVENDPKPAPAVDNKSDDLAKAILTIERLPLSDKDKAEIILKLVKDIDK